MLPRFAHALETYDPGEGAHWAWSKETGYLSADQVGDLSQDESSDPVEER